MLWHPQQFYDSNDYKVMNWLKQSQGINLMCIQVKQTYLPSTHMTETAKYCTYSTMNAQIPPEK